MLLDIPREIQEAIVIECARIEPKSIAALAQTCRILQALINHGPDSHLWRSIFLIKFDDPRPALSVLSGQATQEYTASFEWQKEAQRRFRAAIRMAKALDAETADFRKIVDEDAVDALWDTAILSLPHPTPAASTEEEVTVETESKNEDWLEDCLRSAILPKVRDSALAKIHILASFVHARTSVSLPAASTISASSRLRSRAYVYDMRNYTKETKWGPWVGKKTTTNPFVAMNNMIMTGGGGGGGGDDDDDDDEEDEDWQEANEEQEPSESSSAGLFSPVPDSSSTPASSPGAASSSTPESDKPEWTGQVNWEHLWHLINVVRHNAAQRDSSELPTLGLDNLRSYSAPRNLDDPPFEGDWAGVGGIWYRAISFMDYRDLHEYNSHQMNPDGTLSTRIFENLSFDEAFRLIKGNFTVTSVDSTGPEHHPKFPTIHFVGDATLPSLSHDMTFTGMHIQRITKGTVSMTKNGFVRWSFVTRVGGHRWASEGVGLGGIQARAGVIGVWSSADHEDGDPAGPFWLWRSDEAKEAHKRPNPPQMAFHVVVNFSNV